MERGDAAPRSFLNVLLLRSSFSRRPPPLPSLRSLPPTCFKQRCFEQPIQRGWSTWSVSPEKLIFDPKTTKDKLAEGRLVGWARAAAETGEMIGGWNLSQWTFRSRFNAWNVVGRERIRGFIYHHRWYRRLVAALVERYIVVVTIGNSFFLFPNNRDSNANILSLG